MELGCLSICTTRPNVSISAAVPLCLYVSMSLCTYVHACICNFISCVHMQFLYMFGRCFSVFVCDFFVKSRLPGVLSAFLCVSMVCIKALLPFLY